MSTESLLLAATTHVTCPKCAQVFSLEQGFAKQALEAIEVTSSHSLRAVREQERAAATRRAQQTAEEHDKAMTELRSVVARSFQPQLEALATELKDSQAKVTAVDQREALLVVRERSIEARVAEAAATRAAELVAAERQSYEQRLLEQQGQVQSLRAEQVALREDRRKIKDQSDGLALQLHQQLDAKLAERETAVRIQEQQRTALEKADLQKKLDDASGQLADAQRKMAQGSQQLQGEVLELAIEAGLRRAFPLDAIEEVKKGLRGGDIVQRVMSRTGQSAGTMLWETKRAQAWSPAWIDKFKEDIRVCGADVGVLVTLPAAIPKEWGTGQPFGLHEDVWVVTWPVAVHLADVLRTGLLDAHKRRLVSTGKGEKMEAVYDYLTSPQFAQKLKAVYGAFQALHEDLGKERAATEQRFARREKQIATGMKELLGFAGNVQGLAQQELPALELAPEHAFVTPP